MDYNTITCDDEKIKRIKALLKLYRSLLFCKINKVVSLDDELYGNSRKRISDVIGDVVIFETKEKENNFYDTICSCHLNNNLIDLFDKTLVKLKDYPENGVVYYGILERLYFDNSKYTSEEIMEALDLSRSGYFQNLKKACSCYYKVFIGVLRYENNPAFEEFMSKAEWSYV